MRGDSWGDLRGVDGSGLVCGMSKKAVRPLTAKETAFVEHYLETLNSAEAARLAGYAPNNARKLASEVLKRPMVRAKVQAAMDARSKRTAITADIVLQELLKIARCDLSEAYDAKGNLLPIKDMPEDCRRAIAGIKVFEEFEGFGKERFKIGEVREVKFWDKPKALELLGKHLKLFTDKIEHSGKLTLEDLVGGSNDKDKE